MLPKQRSKSNLRILEMLREKGAPSLSPFPGEQGFETEDLDLDQMGDILLAKGQPEQSKKKKKRDQTREESAPIPESE